MFSHSEEDLRVLTVTLAITQMSKLRLREGEFLGVT
jgi:hypothetical protein